MTDSFLHRGRLVALAAAILVTAVPGLLVGFANRPSCSEGQVEVACPTDPVGQAVSDAFAFVHQPLGPHGSITARVTSMTGIITYPPPNHDEIVQGLVPWAKAGIIVKDGTAQGSPYAAVLVTGGHGTRLQYDYTHDVAGSPGRVTAESPRWLRLTRSGDSITGYESTDGTQWTEIGTAHLAGLPDTVRVGLFATSPGDLTLKSVALGGSIAESRFTQASAVFDNVRVDGASAGGWSHDIVGEMGHADWEKNHRAAGSVESNGTFTVTGSGDIGPMGTEGGRTVEDFLIGVVVSLMIVVVVAVRSGAATLVTGVVALGAGGLAAGIAVSLGTRLARASGTVVPAVSGLTEARVVAGVAVLFALTAVLAVAIGVLVRRTWAAILVAGAAVVLPYALGALPLLPDAVSTWLLRLTPAAGFAVQQTIHRYPQVVAHYAPSAGYFPLAWWAGIAVLGGYAVALLAVALLRTRHRTVLMGARPRWR